MHTKPPALKPGARIGICAPSSRINPMNFEAGIDVLKNDGFDVFVHPQCHMNFGQMAGTARERASAFSDLLCDPAIDAVFFAAGGHRGAEILPLMDWSKCSKLPHPKIVMGFSDNTVLLCAIRTWLNWTTFFGPTVGTIGRTARAHPDTWARTKSLLQGGKPDYDVSYKGRKTEGVLVPATLSLLSLMLGTEDMPSLEGAILCIEDIGEELSTIDRNMLMLKRHGLFDIMSGLVLGDFTDTRDSGRPFGFDVNEIARYHAGPQFPIATGAPVGHSDRIYAMPLGTRARLDKDKLVLLDDPVK